MADPSGRAETRPFAMSSLVPSFQPSPSSTLSPPSAGTGSIRTPGEAADFSVPDPSGDAEARAFATSPPVTSPFRPSSPSAPSPPSMGIDSSFCPVLDSLDDSSLEPFSVSFGCIPTSGEAADCCSASDASGGTEAGAVFASSSPSALSVVSAGACNSGTTAESFASDPSGGGAETGAPFALLPLAPLCGSLPSTRSLPPPSVASAT
mmetsp:Transcript_58851/g.175102  ORF Transcript_58851/g.175102 Transcript_58851/m.175102 type:complete len:207 (+) Transcript_58851:650-1270(+)